MLFSEGPGEGLTAARPGSSPLFFATTVYSFEGISNLLPVENALEDKREMQRLVYVGLISVGIIYFLVGLLCYLAMPHVSAGSITAELSATVRLSAPLTDLVFPRPHPHPTPRSLPPAVPPGGYRMTRHALTHASPDP